MTGQRSVIRVTGGAIFIGSSIDLNAPENLGQSDPLALLRAMENLSLSVELVLGCFPYAVVVTLVYAAFYWVGSYVWRTIGGGAARLVQRAPDTGVGA